MADRRQPQFYVYRFDDDGGCVYVGKGSKSRIRAQERRFRKLAPLATGRIVDWYLTEAAALEGEKRYIASLSPRLNLTSGGDGDRVRRPRRMLLWERNIIKFGSRRWAAHLLLACERSRPGTVDPSKVEAIRQVAHGAR